jgi:hypothetical protein
MPDLSVPLLTSVVTAIVATVFAALVFLRWWGVHKRGRKAPHLLAWGAGLAFFAIGAITQTLLYFVWNPYLFGLWYWSGGLMTAAWLGQGTIYLLVRRGNIARNLGMVLTLASLMTLPWALFATPLNGAAWTPGADLYVILNDVMQRGGVRGFSPVLNIYGTLGLVGGAIYSSVLFHRKQILRDRMLGNWLIAAGGLSPALSGVMIRIGVPDLKYVGELVGVILIFIGYLLATRAQDEPAKASRRWEATAAPQTADAPATPR